MTSAQLDSFLHKFKNLWYAGFDARLAAGTHAGQAWVSIEVGLGHPQQVRNRNKNGPSRQRRRKRHEAARKEGKVELEGEQPIVVTEEVTANDVPVRETENVSENNLQNDGVENTPPPLHTLAIEPASA